MVVAASQSMPAAEPGKTTLGLVGIGIMGLAMVRPALPGQRQLRLRHAMPTHARIRLGAALRMHGCMREVGLRHDDAGCKLQ